VLCFVQQLFYRYHTDSCVVLCPATFLPVSYRLLCYALSNNYSTGIILCVLCLKLSIGVQISQLDVGFSSAFGKSPDLNLLDSVAPTSLQQNIQTWLQRSQLVFGRSSLRIYIRISTLLTLVFLAPPPPTKRRDNTSKRPLPLRSISLPTHRSPVILTNVCGDGTLM
jgi:hypothetical protein